MERWEGQENANDTLEKPVIWELLGDVSGKKVLDSGCGDARFGVELLNLRFNCPKEWHLLTFGAADKKLDFRLSTI
ncbi:hypothetical protein [Paenibacillus sp. A14]|uniref:hypothetical protein n=1 Tax=Paenibacillus sp. A14 TaxID=3119820 RepID=UPI002FE230F8